MKIHVQIQELASDIHSRISMHDVIILITAVKYNISIKVSLQNAT